MVLVALNSLSSRKSSVRPSGIPSELIPSRLNCIRCSSAGAKPGCRSSAWTAPEVPAVARRKAPTQDSRTDFAGLAAARGNLAGGPLGPGRRDKRMQPAPVKHRQTSRESRFEPESRHRP